MQYTLKVAQGRIDDFLITLQELKRQGIIEDDSQEEEIKKEKIE